MKSYHWPFAFVGAAVVILSGCSPDQLVPEQIHKNTVEPKCLAGFCLGDDPFPDSAGVYIASTINGADCFGDEMTDSDEDGLADLCESSLAGAFEPVLYYSSSDTWIDREPAYAVRPLGTSSGVYGVRILYMPSYYADGGSSSCNDGYWEAILALFGEPASTLCGHYGDSEAIVEDVHYDPTTEHWLLDGLQLSMHTFYNGLCHTSGGVCAIPSDAGSFLSGPVYASKDGGQPLVYVSYSKHANDFDQTSCGSHWPTSHFEVCSSDATALLGLNVARNVGSSSVHLMDCVYPQTYPYSVIYATNQECYWTGTDFGGWMGTSPTSDPYSNRLSAWGF